MKSIYMTIAIVALAFVTGCGPGAAKFKRNSHGPLFFDYAGSSKPKTKPVDAGPCPTCGGDSNDPVVPDTCDGENGGNSPLNDDKTDGDLHQGNGEDNNDHEAQHDDQCAPVSNG